jgi:hypothetical protein
MVRATRMILPQSRVFDCRSLRRNTDDEPVARRYAWFPGGIGALFIVSLFLRITLVQDKQTNQRRLQSRNMMIMLMEKKKKNSCRAA